MKRGKVHKLKLDLEDLEIASFETGGVHAHTEFVIIVDDQNTQTQMTRPYTAIWNCSGCSGLDTASCKQTLDLTYEPVCVGGVNYTYDRCDNTRPV